jgi:hypothetical protein
MGQVLDIVQRYGGNVLSAGRGDRMRSDEAGSRASFASTPSSGKALADMVIEVPSERLNCAIGELTSHALGKLAHYEVCRPYVSNGVVNLTGRLLNRRAPQVIRFRLVPKDAPAGDTIVGAQGLTKVQRDIDEIATPQQKETGESPLVLSAPCGGKPGRR